MPGNIDCLKKLVPRLVEASGGVIIAGVQRERIEAFEGDAGLEKVGEPGQRAELVVGRHEGGIRVALALSAFVIDEDLWEEAGPVEVEVGREHVEGKVVDGESEATWDVSVTEMLAHDRSVLTFDQGIVVGLSGTGLGELGDVEFVEQSSDAVIDVLRAVIGMEAGDVEREGVDECFEDGDEEALGDLLDRTDDFELSDLIDGVDEINAFNAVEIALMDGIDAQVAGSVVGGGFTSFADRNAHGTCFIANGAHALIGFAVAQVVEVAVGNVSETLVAGVTEETEGALAELAGGGTGEVAVEGIELGQQATVVVGIAPGERFGWCAPPVVDDAGESELREQAHELLSGQAGHATQVAGHESAVALAEVLVAEVFERQADETVRGLTISGNEFNGIGAVEKRADLLQGLEPMGK